MPSDERKHAKIANFVDYVDMLQTRPLRERPVDSEALASFRDISVRIQRRESTPAGERLEFTALKNRDTPALLPGKTEEIHFRCENATLNLAEILRLSRPTSWDHLLRDEGLG